MGVPLSRPEVSEFTSPEFQHAFQPIIDIHTGDVFGYEALLRGVENQPPWYLFEQVEKKHAANFEKRINTAALRKQRELGNPYHTFLNVTSSSLIEDSGQYLIDFTSKAPSISASNVVLELSEGSIIHNFKHFVRTLNNLRTAGFSIAMDDFGAGYAGLNALVEVNPDIIKLDMYLIRDIQESGPRQATVRAIVSLCEALGILVLAEGVENLKEYDFLCNQGIHLYQGFLFAKPEINYLEKSIELPNRTRSTLS